MTSEPWPSKKMTGAEWRRLKLLRKIINHNDPLKVIEAMLAASYDRHTKEFLIPSVTKPDLRYRVDVDNRHCGCPAFTSRCYHQQAAQLLKKIFERIVEEDGNG
jgi:hypothetical protein